MGLHGDFFPSWDANLRFYFYIYLLSPLLAETGPSSPFLAIKTETKPKFSALSPRPQIFYCNDKLQSKSDIFKNSTFDCVQPYWRFLG